jgi:hypothetical protein
MSDMNLLQSLQILTGLLKYVKGHPNMRLLQFYGASDDLFEIEGSRRNEPDEISPSSAVKITLGDEGFIVSAHYGPALTPCWAIGISQLDEDMPLPDWPIKFTTGAPSRGYSVVLNVEAPDDVVLTEIVNP